MWIWTCDVKVNVKWVNMWCAVTTYTSAILFSTSNHVMHRWKSHDPSLSTHELSFQNIAIIAWYISFYPIIFMVYSLYKNMVCQTFWLKITQYINRSKQTLTSCDYLQGFLRQWQQQTMWVVIHTCLLCLMCPFGWEVIFNLVGKETCICHDLLLLHCCLLIYNVLILSN